jgi:hypothetical protein
MKDNMERKDREERKNNIERKDREERKEMGEV